MFSFFLIKEMVTHYNTILSKQSEKNKINHHLPRRPFQLSEFCLNKYKDAETKICYD